MKNQSSRLTGVSLCSAKTHWNSIMWNFQTWCLVSFFNEGAQLTSFSARTTGPAQFNKISQSGYYTYSMLALMEITPSLLITTGALPSIEYRTKPLSPESLSNAFTWKYDLFSKYIECFESNKKQSQASYDRKKISSNFWIKNLKRKRLFFLFLTNFGTGVSYNHHKSQYSFL